ncbi:MAG: 3-dehydroquinate synthase [Acutalibacteraceae bacterium]|nr:3-dehydroquinate synthase [Acutalibacteraceae bacterium]
MTEVEVKASGNYKVIIGDGLIKNIGNYIKDFLNPIKTVIITDDIVDSLYSQTVENSLKNSGFEVLKYVIENGEKSKNGQNFLKICEFLAENHITKSDLIIALGGGVVGDLAGFVSASYLRSIKFIQVPTTLLAAVDSSVGGKTAIDIKSGKNLVGAFYQPKLVLCDYSTLSTLKPEIFTDGCAEVIKYAVIGNKELFNHLLEKGKNFDLEYVISECIKMKRDIVEKDEFDSGERQKLNLGHTIGHSVELCSNFEISHGSAVAIGLAIIARASAKKGLCSNICAEKIVEILEKFELPTKTNISSEELYKPALSDKKRSGNSLNLVIPYDIGDSRLLKTNVSDLITYIEAGI